MWSFCVVDACALGYFASLCGCFLFTYDSLFGISCFFFKVCFMFSNNFATFPFYQQYIEEFCKLHYTCLLIKSHTCVFYLSVYLWFWISLDLLFFCFYYSQLRRVLCQLSSVCSQFSWHLRETSRYLCPGLSL